MKRKQVRPINAAIENIRYYISSHSLEPDDMLPGERDLSSMWGISRTTIRAALAKLQAEGDIYRKKGVGTFVSARKILRDVRLTESTTDSIVKQGYQNGVQLLESKTVDADTSLLQHLHIPLGTKVRELVRLRYIDHTPAMIERNYLEEATFRKLIDFDSESQSLYSALKKYGMPVSRGNESIQVVDATQTEIDLLKLDSHTLLYLVEGSSYDEGGQPVEYFKSVVRPELTRFVSVLKK